MINLFFFTKKMSNRKRNYDAYKMIDRTPLKLLNDERMVMMRRIISETLSQEPDTLISKKFMDYVGESFQQAPHGQIHNSMYFIVLAGTYLPIFEQSRSRPELHTNEYIYQHMVRNWVLTMRGQIGPESFIRTYMQHHLSLKESPPYFATGMPDTFLSNFSNLQAPSHPLYKMMFDAFCIDCMTACEYMKERIKPCLIIQDHLRNAQALERRLIDKLDEDLLKNVNSFLTKKVPSGDDK